MYYTYTLYTELHTYTRKEELKTILRELLACAQPNRHETFTVIRTPTVECPRGGDMRKYAIAEERATKTQKMTVRHFGFTEKVYGSAVKKMPSWECAIAVAPSRAASVHKYIIICCFAAICCESLWQSETASAAPTASSGGTLWPQISIDSYTYVQVLP